VRHPARSNGSTAPTCAPPLRRPREGSGRSSGSVASRQRLAWRCRAESESGPRSLPQTLQAMGSTTSSWSAVGSPPWESRQEFKCASRAEDTNSPNGTLQTKHRVSASIKRTTTALAAPRVQKPRLRKSTCCITAVRVRELTRFSSRQEIAALLAVASLPAGVQSGAARHTDVWSAAGQT
jgi:hypothetical protein